MQVLVQTVAVWAVSDHAREKNIVVAVVGSGMSGCAVAAELTRHGVPVIVVEAGPDAGRNHVASRPETAPLIDPAADQYFVPFSEEAAGPHYVRSSGFRRRVGGRSLYWRGICLRIEPYALEDWPPVVRDALVRTGGTGLYDQVETMLERWTGRPLQAVRSNREALLLEAIRAKGYSSASATPRAIRALEGLAWDAYSPLSELPPEAVLTERAVVGFSPASTDTVELHLAGSSDAAGIRARAVVLCAGTIEIARLAAGLTASHGVAASPRAFRVADHHVQGWVAVSRGGAPVDASVLVLRDDEARSNVVLEASSLGEFELLDAWAMGEQLLTDSTMFSFDDQGRVRFDLTLTSSDHEVLDRQACLLDALAGAMGVAGEPRPVLDDTLDYDLAVERAKAVPGHAIPYYCRLGSLDHESGSLALGSATVDEMGRLRGFGPIFAAGPAVFPRCGAANPSLTTLAVSRYIAQNVLTII
jgi:choline dehydrogenase-like flavoprotein